MNSICEGNVLRMEVIWNRRLNSSTVNVLLLISPLKYFSKWRWCCSEMGSVRRSRNCSRIIVPERWWCLEENRCRSLIANGKVYYRSDNEEILCNLTNENQWNDVQSIEDELTKIKVVVENSSMISNEVRARFFLAKLLEGTLDCSKHVWTR